MPLRTRFCWIALFTLLSASPSFAGEIHRAVTQGDQARVTELLRADPGLIRAQDENSTLDYPLHTAAAAGQVEIARILLHAGTNIDCEDSDGSTPLHVAAVRRQPAMVEFLLSQGANVNRRDRNGAYALTFAASGGDSSIVRMVLDSGSDLNFYDPVNGNTLIHMACSRGLFWFADYLRDRGADINARNRAGVTPLNLTCQGRFPQRLEAILDRGADPALADSFGMTPLHAAAWNWNNQPEMVRILLAHGADVNARDHGGRTPIWGAAARGDSESTRMLLDRGAKADVRSNDGTTAFEDAVEAGHAEVAALLLQAGAPIRGGGSTFGWTLLHKAAALGYEDIARLLVDHGADIEAKDDSGRTPAQLAEQYGRPELAAMLRTGGEEKAPSSKPGGLAGTPKLGAAEAKVWYLGHSAWGVKTANHFLVFDYGDMGRRADRHSLDGGDIDPAELAGENVTVFASHEHGDHYMPSIFDWRTRVSKINYVLGFQPGNLEGAPAYEAMAPRETRTINGMKVATIRSTDAGVGFLVEVDGLSIFHSGDHANMTSELSTAYKDEIDWLVQNGARPDIAFVPLVGCGATAQGGPEAGAKYVLSTMKPKALFPMHGGLWGTRYVDFIADISKDMTTQTAMLGAACKGDHYRYAKGKVS
jgi:ankyrin repeat protein/L-ascorbate metabolism protein UlaG (beta-lactamase superfamily)